MVFARCLGVESDFLFGSFRSQYHGSYNSVIHRTPRQSTSAASTQSSSSNGGMPTILGWNRKNNHDAPECENDMALPTATHGKSHHSHHKHKHERGSTSQTNQAHGVTFRRADKSFLEFHQNYAITRHLGEGSYSTVKQVTHRKRGGIFACKIVDKSALSSVDCVALSHEVKVLASIRHDHIMRLYEVIEDDTKCYLIMELAEHGDLFDKIVKQGKFPQEEAQKVTAALCEALHHCHSNAVIHRDVKPENVLLSNDPHCIKLCDFGFAKQLSDPTEKSVDSCGTPGYAAPEILDGKPYGVEVDVFSLGVVTYIMLCGYPPFPMKLSQLRTHRFNVRFPSKDWSSTDASVKELITRMLSVKPELRPKTSELREHPWIVRGKEILDQGRLEAEAKCLEEALQRKQLVADTIRKKLTSTTGFDVIKHGRQGQPHRTKLRLSTDGRVLSWQPKLLKRGLLKYHQNAKSFTSFFGFGSKRNMKREQAVAHPQISRLSSSENARSGEGGRYSEPILCDDTQHSAIVGSVQNNELDARVSGSSQHQLSKADSTSSTTSSGSTSWIDKNWWRPFRRGDNAKVASNTSGAHTERSASGGFTFAAFSMSNDRKVSRSLSSSGSSCSAVSDSYETAVPDTADHSAMSSRISFSSATSELSSPSVSPRIALGLNTPPMSPTASSPGVLLDSSVNLRDIRAITLGEDSAFFQTLTGFHCEASCCRDDGDAVSSRRPTTTTTTTTTTTDSCVDHDDEDAADSTKNPRPGSNSSSSSSSLSAAASDLNISTTLTIATRFRELHLEFSSEETRDAFAFLLEQATLPLEDVAHKPQQSFIFRSAMTPMDETPCLDAKKAEQTEENDHE